MNRREFLEKSGCAMPCIVAAPAALDQATETQSPQPQTPRLKPPNYKIEVEIFEARENSWCHKKGDKFEWPRDMGKICPWLRSSMHDFIVVLATGGTLSWKYEGTPYQKVIDPDGITTEFVRCPDPTANLVAKIIRTKQA
jgi:uncharacterized repeat protein (TIGR04076 family)